MRAQPIFLLCLCCCYQKEIWDVRETARRYSLSFSDQIIFPSIDRGNTGKADGSFHRTPSPFQVVKSLSRNRGCAHSRASGRRSLQEYGLLLYNKWIKAPIHALGDLALKSRSYSLYTYSGHAIEQVFIGPSNSDRPSFLYDRELLAMYAR